MTENILEDTVLARPDANAEEGFSSLERGYINSIKTVQDDANIYYEQFHGDALRGAAYLGASAPPVANGRFTVPLAARTPRLADMRTPGPSRTTRTRVVRRWTGVVTEIEGDVFLARLSTASPGGEDLIAEFMIDEVSEDDISLLKPGAWFYVNVARQAFTDGRYSTISSIRFRRLAKWRPDELDLARERAEKLAGLLEEG